MLLARSMNRSAGPFATVRGGRRVPGTLRLALLTIAAVAASASAETIEKPPQRVRFVVRGLTEFEPHRLARALAANDELLLLGSPLANRKTFLSAVGDKATQALQREGFAAAKATVTVEAGEAGDRVVVDVVEGPRQMAAGIEVTGLPDDLAQELKRWLKSQRPPPGAVPLSSDDRDGWSGTRWFDQLGQPARMELPAWRTGQPAPLDPQHLLAVRATIARFLREHGFFAAAKLLDTQKPATGKAGTGPAIDVAVRSGDDGATLVVSGRNLPPATVLRGVEVFPGSRTNPAELQKILGIVPGKTVTERDRLAWREALRLSGRFIRHEVKLKEVPPADGDGGVPGAVAIFDLAAYPHVPPLAEPLSREDQVVLLFRTWLLQTLANDDDLVLAWTQAPAAGQPAVARGPVGSVVISTHDGVLLTALPSTAEACGMAVSGDGLGWFLPGAAGRYEVPLPGRNRITLNVALFLTETIEGGRHEYPRRFDVSYGIEPRPRDAAAALAVTARIEPVACLAFLHEGQPQVAWEGEELVVARSDMTARFDSRTGRLISIAVPAGGSVAVEAAPGRFAAALASLRTAAGENVARKDALVSTGLKFLVGESMAASLGHLLEPIGCAKSLAAWQSRLDAVAEKLRRTADSGGFAVADRLAGGMLSRATDEAAGAPLTIPSAAPPSAAATDQPTQLADSHMAVARIAAAKAWRWAEWACGRDAWPTALARVATLASRGDSGVLWEVSAFMTGKRNGPLAFLAAASAAPMPSMAGSLARQGQTRLSPEAFQADCQPLLAILGCFGLDRCAVGLLRMVEDDEAKLLGERCLQDPTVFLPLVHDLRGRESDDAAVKALPEVLDHWWRDSLHGVLATALAARAELQTADKPAAEAAPVR